MDIRNEFNMVLEKFKKENPVAIFNDQDVYADWLAQTYYFVIHSTSLLGYALPHLKSQPLRHHFEKHLGEETRHDLLALKDIERLGSHITKHEEYASTQAFYQSQYYRISFEGGTSLLGYILFLEGMAVHWGKDIYDNMRDKYKNSMLFLKVHAEEDPDHLESAIKTIMTLSKEEQASICQNLRFSHLIYNEIIKSVLREKSLKAAA